MVFRLKSSFPSDWSVMNEMMDCSIKRLRVCGCVSHSTYFLLLKKEII